MKNRGLAWIWTIEEPEGPDDYPPIQSDDLTIPYWEPQPWHYQFYAWLYLVPSDDASLLRHQFRKTVVLEGKGGAERGSSQATKALQDCDRLMGLYTQVQSAGFSGTEHVLGDDFRDLLYEDPSLFDEVYSEENEKHLVSFPGTRRGLRQIQRFGHYAVLEKIFRKHKVTVDEVETFTSLDTSETKALFESRSELRKKIQAFVKEKSTDLEPLTDACSEYKEIATETALYTFRANAARLAEHARLHQLLMRVVGRLTDFTLIWERDAIYVFLGMLYRQLEDKGGVRVVARPTGGGKVPTRIGIQLPDKMDLSRGIGATEQGDDRFLRLWDDDNGFSLPYFIHIKGLLDKENARLFQCYFDNIAEENPKDVAAAKVQRAKGKRPRKSEFRKGKRQIRNDFAHYNVVSAKNNRINLTYLTSAVRSLLSYDRKLKNAVSKAIKDIVADDGLTIEWQLDQDRLKHPLVMPDVETHLTMVRDANAGNVWFNLPRRSVRYTSMVKALFDFDTGGYRRPINRNGKKERKGRLDYPEAFWRTYADHVPTGMFIHYPELPSEDS